MFLLIMCEVFDFVGSEVTPRAGGQAGQADVADADAGEAGDGVADGGQHPPHLPVAALENGQFDFRRPLPSLTRLGVSRRAKGTDDADTLGGRRHPIFQQHTLGKTGQRGGVGDARDGGAVGLGNVVAGVSQAVQELAIIGQKDQPLAVGVQTPDGPQQGLALEVHQVRDDARGVDVGAGADDAARLVQGDIITLVRKDDRPAVKRDLVRAGVNLRSQLGHDLTVHPHPPLLDPGLARAPRADAAGGEHFL